jgi:Holliday junction DNA helicase RuvB
MLTSLLSPTSQTEDVQEQSLRPTGFDHYIGQSHVKESLQIAVMAAKARSESIDHILLYGPPGLGKTSLAHIVAREMGVSVRTAAGPALTKAGDLAAILTNLQEGDVLFIDEIHRLQRSVEETLYPAMEDRALDIILGKGPSARSVRIDLPHFTLVGATTRAGSLSHPLRDRFGHIHRLDFYSDEELAAILARSASLLNMAIDDAGLLEVAKRSRKTPRVANRLLRRVRDYAMVLGNTSITKTHALEALDHLHIDSLGLDKIDREILTIVANQFSGGPVGLETLAAATGEEAETLEDVIEPYLLRIGMLERTPRGRIITNAARTHLGIALPIA